MFSSVACCLLLIELLFTCAAFVFFISWWLNVSLFQTLKTNVQAEVIDFEKESGCQN